MENIWETFMQPFHQPFIERLIIRSSYVIRPFISRLGDWEIDVHIRELQSVRQAAAPPRLDLGGT